MNAPFDLNTTPAAPAAAEPSDIEFGDPRLPERFWAKVQARDTGCWEWTAMTVQGGYGRYIHKGRKHLVHRVAHELLIGPIPDGLLVLHNCDNPPCCNPAHLRAGTAKDNMQDRLERGRNPQVNKTHCKHGHPLSGENLYTAPDGERGCRTCRTEASRRYNLRRSGRNPAAGEAA